jgi:hypothetical protein
MNTRDRLAIFVLIAAGVVWWNGRFSAWCTPQRIGEMNDVPAILAGYHTTPNLLSDGLAWWSGPWIQQGIGAFRPISSYLLWTDCWIGTHFGFFWTALVGVAILLVDCLLCAALAWRFTRSWVGVLTAALLAPAGLRFIWNRSVPEYWLAWFPVHHDLLMIGWLLGALLAFDLWLEYGRAKYLALTWGCFALGVLSKEFNYIFPVMAGALALGRTLDGGSEGGGEGGVRRTEALRQVAFMVAFVTLLAVYRHEVLPQAYNPPRLKWVHMLRRPWLYWAGPFYLHVLSGEGWFAGLAAWWFVLGGALIRWKRRGRAVRLAGPLTLLVIALGMPAATVLYLTVVGWDAVTTFWYFSDGIVGRSNLWRMAQMLATLYAFFLLFKYRRETPSLAAAALMMLAYIPVWTYLGWHYTLAGWFVRCAVFWPLVAHLVVRDLAGYWPGLQGWSRQRRSRTKAAAASGRSPAAT